MKVITKPIRIDPAFDQPEQIRAMFERHAPYPAIATYTGGDYGVVDENTHQDGEPSALPWFRGTWALGGKPLVEGAEVILHNKGFLEAARVLFGTPNVHPEFVVVNLTAPMPAGEPHIDFPAFRGATRERYPLPFLKAMGSSGLFETWRVLQAGALWWAYEGIGGNFDYWPEGLDGPMLSERPPFRNVSLVADNDRMYHRIGAIGDPDASLPRMSASAQIHPAGDGNWTIIENGEVRATYPGREIRLTVVWKAEVRDREFGSDVLTLGRIMEIFTSDLHRRNVDFQMPSDPLTDPSWILLLQRTY